MSRLLSTRLSVSLAAAAVAVTALAAPALAVDPTPAQNAKLLQASDLPSSYGTPAPSSFTNVQKGGELEFACFAAEGNDPTTSVGDKVTMFSNIDYPSGISWNQAIFVYKSKAQATKAFGQLTSAVPKCQGSATTTKGDDNTTIPARTTTVTAKVTNGVIVATEKATSKAGAKTPYADAYLRKLTARVGNAIESLTVDSPKPITAAQKRTQDSAFAKLLARYNG